MRTSPRLTPVASAYVVSVGVLAVLGFATGTTALLLVAVGLTLPGGLVALAGYVLAYRLLALIPGAQHDRLISSSANGGVVELGVPAGWFAVSVSALGVLLLLGAAVVTVTLVRRLRDTRRPTRRPSPGPVVSPT